MTHQLSKVIVKAIVIPIRHLEQLATVTRWKCDEIIEGFLHLRDPNAR